jgi:2-aminoethylphosphonate transport system permease protein
VSVAALPAAAPAKRRESVRFPAALAASALAVGLIFYYPLALILAEAVQRDENGRALGVMARTFASPLVQTAVLRTVEIAALSTAGCVLLGLTLALCLTFAPFPGSGAASRLIDAFIALPTFLMTLAFTFLYGSAGLLNGALKEAFALDAAPLNFLYSMAGVVLAEVTVYTPFVLRPLLAALSQVESGQIEVALSLGAGPWRVLRTVVLPALTPALLAGGSLCLLLTVNEFGIPLFIGAKGVITLPLLVYGKAIQEGDYGAACAVAALNMTLSTALYAFYRGMVARLPGAA